MKNVYEISKVVSMKVEDNGMVKVGQEDWRGELKTMYFAKSEILKMAEIIKGEESK